MTKLPWLNSLPWYARLPIKWSIFGAAALAVCFPYPGLLWRHLEHWSDADALIEPDAVALQPLVEELRPILAETASPRAALREVERYVYERIKYEWDWNTWGLVDYLPTVTEVIEQGREDCDGRAVVAASLLKNYGFDAHLVTDLAHVWVQTDRGDAMGPGNQKAIETTERGLKLRLRGLLEFPRALAYGIAVFPLRRELILAFVAWSLMLDGRRGLLRKAAPLAALLAGLFLLRAGGGDYHNPVRWLQMSGGAAIVAVIAWSVAQGRRRITPSGSPIKHGERNQSSTGSV